MYQRIVIMVEKNETLYLTFPTDTEIYNPYYIYPSLQQKDNEFIFNQDTIIDIYRAPAIMINDINNYIVKDEFGLPKYPYLPTPIYEII